MDSEMEVWKDVVGYEDYFMVSNLGAVFSKRSNRLLKQSLSNTGYLTIVTRIGGITGKSICFHIHRLVADAFLDPPTKEQLQWAETTKYKKVLVNHKDGDKLNNTAINLEWCTHSENTKHAISLGLLKSKLSEENIKFIKENYISGSRKYGQRALARMFGVAHTTIARAINAGSNS